MNDTVAAFPLVSLQPVADGHHAWAALLLAAPFERDPLSRLFGEFGLYEALGQLPCILRLGDPAACPGDAGECLPAEKIFLCLPAAVAADPGRADDLDRLRRLGFHLMAEGLPPAGGALPAAIAAVALPCPGGAPSHEIAALLAGHGGPHLATGVETPEAHAACRDFGFRWFAGNYPLHPEAGALPTGTTHEALLLRLLGLVAVDAEAHELEELFKQDAHLSYQLLRLVNSVAFSLSTKIASFGQAITLLGRRQLQRWLQLLIYARRPGADTNPLMPRAALRAELMEVLCGRLGGNRELQDRAFMVGMFSLLPQLLHMTTERIIGPLHLADDVTGALMEHGGLLGRLLAAVEAAEGGTGPALAAAVEGLGVDAETWARSLVQAYHWAIRISQEA